jgi:hypothetical protein
MTLSYINIDQASRTHIQGIHIHYYGATTLSIMTLSLMTLSIMTFSIMTLSIMTFSMKTFSITQNNI